MKSKSIFIFVKTLGNRIGNAQKDEQFKKLWKDLLDVIEHPRNYPNSDEIFETRLQAVKSYLLEKHGCSETLKLPRS